MSRVDRLICHALPKALLMALVADGRLVELQIVRRDQPSLVEGVFLGRLERVMPELDAAFVDIGTGRSGFLRAEDRAGIDVARQKGDAHAAGEMEGFLMGLE